MQVLQESKETETVQGVPTTSVAASVREPEIMKLKAGMKAALAHIKDLECFIDEMYVTETRCTASASFITLSISYMCP